MGAPKAIKQVHYFSGERNITTTTTTIISMMASDGNAVVSFYLWVGLARLHTAMYGLVG